MIQVRCNVLKLLYKPFHSFSTTSHSERSEVCVLQVWFVQPTLFILPSSSSSLFFLFIASQSVELLTRSNSSFKVVDVSKVSSTTCQLGFFTPSQLRTRIILSSHVVLYSFLLTVGLKK